MKYCLFVPDKEFQLVRKKFNTKSFFMEVMKIIKKIILLYFIFCICKIVIAKRFDIEILKQA